MPNDPGPSSWVGSQYQRFLEGVERTGHPNAPRLARVEQPVRVDPGKRPQITIPAWDDVLRVSARTPVTPEDMAIQRHFERAGLKSPLAPEIQQEIADRRAMAQRIQNSAVPDYQRGVSAMMTAVDNVQDSALTVAVGARITATAMGRFGSWLAPAVAGFSKLALGLGWLGLALAWFGIAYAAVCQGPRDALAQRHANLLAGLFFKGARKLVPRAQGIPTPIATGGHKGRAGIAMFGVPSGREVANHRASRWAKAKPSFGEILQIGQVAYDHLGYGLALGAIIGFSAESSYAGARRARGENVAVRSPRVNHVLADILAPRVAELSRAALWHRQQCARAVAAAPLILRDPESWGDDLYGLTWITVYASLEPLMWDTDGLAWREPVIAALGDAAWTPWEIQNPVTRALLEELDPRPELDVWPLAGAPRELTAERIVVELGKEMGDALKRWLEVDELDPWRRLIAEMSINVGERVWYWLEGANDWPAWTLAPATAVWESLFLASRWPVISDPPERLLAAWAASEQYARETGERLIPVAVLDRIWSDAGTPLLVLRTGEGPVPPEFLLPWDESSGATEGVAFGSSVDEARARLSDFLADEARRRENPGRSGSAEG